MKIFKRNQLIILVISLMLITAGYLSFTSKNQNVMTSTIADRSDLKIGDAELVSTIPHEVECTEEISKEIGSEDMSTNASINNEEDYYYTTSKLERNNMFSESLATYQEIYNNINATVEAKEEAISKINEINSKKNSIMIAENLIVAKGFEEVVIFVNEDSVSVVVKKENLEQEDVAKIQNIVSRELSVNAENIHISNR